MARRTQQRFQSVKPLGVPGQQLDQLAYYGWIGPAAAMRHLDIHSLSALYRLIKDHRLPFGRVGRRYRFRRDQLDQWVAVRGVDAMAAVERRA